jgi:hypothetical protein
MQLAYRYLLRVTVLEEDVQCVVFSGDPGDASRVSGATVWLNEMGSQITLLSVDSESLDAELVGHAPLDGRHFALTLHRRPSHELHLRA